MEIELRTIPLAIGVMLLGTPLQAQTPEALSKGTTSIAFTLPQSGSSSAGVWRFVSDRDALGVTVSLHVSHQNITGPGIDRGFTSVGFGIGPEFKHYLVPHGPVATFLQSTLDVSWNGADQDDTNSVRQWALSAGGGFGADWFPVEAISIGGYVGMRVTYQTADVAEDVQHSSWMLNTVTSRLTAHIYF